MLNARLARRASGYSDSAWAGLLLEKQYVTQLCSGHA